MAKQDSDELVDYANMWWRASAVEAFQQHFRMASMEAMLLVLEWDSLRTMWDGYIAGPQGTVSNGRRHVSWTPGDGVILTITKEFEPKVYSLDMRVGLNPDGDRVAYAHAFWLGGADQRPKDTSTDTDAKLAAIRQIVEDATAGYARQIAYACGWVHGNPTAIHVTEKRVHVDYGGPLPQAVGGPLKDNIREDLANAGYPGIVVRVDFE